MSLNYMSMSKKAAGFILLNKLILLLWVSAGLLSCTTVQHDAAPVLRVLPPLEVQVTVPEPEQIEARANAAQLDSDVGKLCQEIGKKLGSVSTAGCLSHALVHSGAYSTDGRALVYKDYAQEKNGLPKILVVGGIHGDEYSSFSLLFRWLERLDGHENYANYWRLLPMSNPDGLLSFKPARRTNANGVDLNRNFNTEDWVDKAQLYWREKTGSDKRRDPGPKAESEVETRWISDMIGDWQPDIIVAVHAPYGILDFDSPQPKRLSPPKKIGILHLSLLGTYPGSLGRYGAKDRDIPVLTLELPHAGIMPSKRQQHDLWLDLQSWLAKNLTK